MSHTEERYSAKIFPSPRLTEVNDSLNWVVHKKNKQKKRYNYDISE